MIDFIKELSDSRFKETELPFYPEKIKGYTEAEVDLIASRYNLNIHGQFRQFLLQMGRCSGGLLWGGSFPMYDPRWDVECFKNDQKMTMEDERYLFLDGIDAVENKLFYLFHENEWMRQFYVVTAHPDNYIWRIQAASATV